MSEPREMIELAGDGEIVATWPPDGSAIVLEFEATGADGGTTVVRVELGRARVVQLSRRLRAFLSESLRAGRPSAGEGGG